MKIFKLHFFLIFAVVTAIGTSCEKDENPAAEICGAKGGQQITDRKGRIYKNTDSEIHFYYIGNPDKFSGGMIPCNGLPKEFQKENLLVIYSGIDKGPLSDAGDPSFVYLTLQKIEKAE